MTLKVSELSNCPVSWGIEEADDPRNTPWSSVLDEVASAGYGRIELGPPGYFPVDPAVLGEALGSRGLALASGYVMGFYGAEGVTGVDMAELRSTCAVLAELNAPTLIVMEEMSDSRQRSSGRSDDAERLTESGWARLLEATHAIAAVASGEFGLKVAFHPHVATFVEFEDEIDRFFRDADPTLIGMCVDTGHSVWAGVDPVAVLERHGKRLRYMHLKDVDGSALVEAKEADTLFAAAVEEGIFCPAGTGIVNFRDLRDCLDALDFDGDLAVEQDRTPGRISGAIADAETSARYLGEIGFFAGAGAA
jgi:inosose dehydratase